MKKMLAFASLALVALMTGCTAVNTNDGAVPTEVVVRKVYTPSIDVKTTTVSGEATVNSLFGILNWGVTEYADDAFVVRSNTGLSLFTSPNKVAQQGATYKACAANDADYLLGATYRIDTEDYIVYKKVKCVATGYPGTLKGVAEVKTVKKVPAAK